jgi:phage baseplate assembly protein V
MMRGRLFEFDGRIAEEGGQQFLSGRGLYGDGYTKIRRLEPHGFYSSPPGGSQGLVLFPNGNPDEAYLLGIDHRSHRPSGLPAGTAALYDANGNIIKLIGTGLVVDVPGKVVTFTTGDWTVNAPMVTFNGDVHVGGNITCAGTITDSDGNNGA